MSVNDKISYAQAAEKYRVASTWIAEHYYYRDAIVTASAILSRTTKIKVGTSIVNPFTRHPALLAMSSATLNEMSGGRFILGLGLGIPLWIEDQMGIRMGNPINSIREATKLIQSMLAGEEFVGGTRFIAKDAHLGFKPTLPKNGKKTPVYVAAVKPGMLKLAGEIGDGVILPAGSSPSYVSSAIPIIKEGAKKSGRESTEVVCLVYCSVDDRDANVARGKLKPWLFPILMRPDREELILSDKPEQKEIVKQAKATMSAGKRDLALSMINDEILDSIAVTGNVEDCLRAIERYAGTGITELVLNPIDSDFSSVERLLSRLAL